MTIPILVGEVEQVLLADGWHHVRDGSFEVDAYEFRQEDRAVFTASGPSGLPPIGAMWMEPDGAVLACPLTAVLAVKRGTGEGYARADRDDRAASR